MNIIETWHDRTLFCQFLAPTFGAWFVFAAAIFGLPLTAEQAAIYTLCTGQAYTRARAVTEAWLICGRRAGKSFVLALVAV